MSGIGINFSLHTEPIKKVTFHPKGNTAITTKITTEVVNNIGKKDSYSHLRENGLSKQQIIDTINHLCEPSIAQELIKKVDSFEPEHKKTEVTELGRTLKEDFDIPKSPNFKGLSSGFEPSSAGQAIGKFSTPIISPPQFVVTTEDALPIPQIRQTRSSSAPTGSRGKQEVTPKTPLAQAASTSSTGGALEASSSQTPVVSWGEDFLKKEGFVKGSYRIISQEAHGQICHDYALPGSGGEAPTTLDKVHQWAKKGDKIAVFFAEGGVAHTAVLSDKGPNMDKSLFRHALTDLGDTQKGVVIKTTLTTLKHMYPSFVIVDTNEKPTEEKKEIYKTLMENTEGIRATTSDALREKLSQRR